jgi:protein-S-isoprenylcysteine O-methyltransferase Ste14
VICLLLYTENAVFVNTLSPTGLRPLVLVVMIKGVIEREEQYLTRTFGETYTSYRARVRRWL